MKKQAFLAISILLIFLLAGFASAYYDYYDYPDYRNYRDFNVVYKRVVVNDYPYTTFEYINPYYYGPEIYYPSYKRVPNYKLLYSPYYNYGYYDNYDNYGYDYSPRSIKFYSPYENIKYREAGYYIPRKYY